MFCCQRRSYIIRKFLFKNDLASLRNIEIQQAITRKRPVTIRRGQHNGPNLNVNLIVNVNVNENNAHVLCLFYLQINVIMLLFSVCNAKLGQRDYSQRTSGADGARNPLHPATDETTERFPQIQFQDTGSNMWGAQIRFVSLKYAQIRLVSSVCKNCRHEA